jgi:UBX domain-containing protein 1
VLTLQPPKFGSLDALKAGAGSDDDDDDQQKFFVGGMGKGGGGSGQNVIDPRKIIEAAQQNGAVSASQHEAGRSRAFMGSGYSLSGDNAAPVERNEDAKKIRHTITFWRNGFSVDDGPLRRVDDDANKAFLSDINNGRVPAEFAGEADPYVSLLDKGGQDYEARLPRNQTFSVYI